MTRPEIYLLGRGPGEEERLKRQIADLAPVSDAQLVKIGIRPGERVVDLGCGPGGVLHLLGKHVGPSGWVLGIDRSAHFVADGGQNPFFAGYKDASDPDALVSGAQEIVLEDRVKPPWAATAADAARLHTENDQPAAAQATAQIADAPDAPAAPEPPSAQ